MVKTCQWLLTLTGHHHGCEPWLNSRLILVTDWAVINKSALGCSEDMATQRSPYIAMFTILGSGQDLIQIVDIVHTQDIDMF